MVEPCKLIITAVLREGMLNSPEFKEYQEKTFAIVSAYDSKLVDQFMITQNLGQGNTPNVVIIVEFSSRDDAIEAYSNEAYKALEPIRDKVYEEVKILVC